MNKIEFIKEKIPFTQVANGVLTDKRLSAKAKGLYAYLYSKPDGWDFAIERMCLEMADGEYSISEGLRELQQFGFLTRKRQADGRIVHLVHFPPTKPYLENHGVGQEPHRENPRQGKSLTGKTTVVSNKDNIIIKSISNKESSSLKYLENLPEKDLEEFYNRFECSKPAIQSKAESILLYCQSKGKKYANYRALLLNALKKDFPARKKMNIQITTVGEVERIGKDIVAKYRPSFIRRKEDSK
jgi:hypothetical protein